MWEDQVGPWARYFRILRYDSRGHGASASPAGAYSMDRLGLDAIELLDALALSKVHFCGLSKGGMVGQWLAVREPGRLQRLILANTSPYMGPPANWQARIDSVLANGMEPLAELSIQRWFTESFPKRNPEAVARITSMLLANDPTGYAGCCAAIRDMDMRPFLGLVQCPTLVIGATLDLAAPPPHSELLANSISETRLLMLEAAHLSNVECPTEFTKAVLDFLVP
jgi:3-oxoadipate enol-lactonase